MKKEHFKSSRFALAFFVYISLFIFLIVLIYTGKAEAIWDDLVYALVADVGLYFGAKTLRGYSGKLTKEIQGE